MASSQRSAAALPPPTIDLLLNLIDTRPQAILTSLAQHPQLASQRDAHGYSLVHAAASYNQLDLLRELIRTYNVDVNQRDEDGETALFAAESAEAAKCLVEELGIDWKAKNEEGKTAQEKLAEEETEAHEVYLYLTSVRESNETGARGESLSAAAAEQAGLHPPPPLPNGVKVNVGTMDEQPEAEAPDPEFRRRIEELAARDDFQSAEGQRQLRELVTEAVTDLSADQAGRSVRRRVE